VLATLVTLLPWAARNTVVLGTPVWTTTHGGYTLALANNEVYYAEVVNGPPGEVWSGPNQRKWFDWVNEATAGMSEPQADQFLPAARANGGLDCAAFSRPNRWPLQEEPLALAAGGRTRVLDRAFRRARSVLDRPPHARACCAGHRAGGGLGVLSQAGRGRFRCHASCARSVNASHAELMVKTPVGKKPKIGANSTVQLLRKRYAKKALGGFHSLADSGR
jgi:hypothetical protein